MAKIRLDQRVVELGLAESRTQAQALIIAGKVLDVNRQVLTKAGHQVREDFVVHLKEKLHPWVSRGGMKLSQAIEEFSIDCEGLVVADIGASTGGFTDVLLHHQAKKIFAVDVGYGQLAHKLRNHEHVIVLEKQNARYLTNAEITEPLDAIVCDASFISLKTLLGATMALTKPEAWMVALIKPQFEVGKGRVGKGGVVEDEALHQEVCDDIKAWFNAQEAWRVEGIIKSPITGPKGNVEFLIYVKKNARN